MSSIKNLAIRGTIWTIASYGTSQILRFGSNLILTRLLFPELFGLASLVFVFLIGLHLFSDIGFGPNIIQNKRGDDPDFLNTAWTMQVIRGLGLWFCCFLLASPAANFYGEPRLEWLIPVVGISTVLSGFKSTALYTLNRHMAIRQLVIFELGLQVTNIVVMIVWAWFRPSIWAIVSGSLVSGLVEMVWSHKLTPGRPNNFAWDREAAEDIFSFGKWIFVSTFVTFIGTQADRLILGKLISFELLGIYGIALTLASIPSQIIAAISSKVILPTISKVSDLPRANLRIKLVQNSRLLLVGFALIVTLLVGFGDLLILALYDRRYAQAAWMLPILALGIWPNVLAETLRQALVAIGKPNYQAYGQLFKGIFMCIALPLGFSLKGILGAVIAVALNDLPLYAVITYGLWREGLSSIKQDIAATTLLLMLIASALLIRFGLGLGIPISSVFAV